MRDVPCTILYTMHHTLHTTRYKLYTSYYTLETIPYTLYATSYVPYSIQQSRHSTQYILHFTLYAKPQQRFLRNTIEVCSGHKSECQNTIFVNRRLGGGVAQPGNRFVPLVRACARSVCLARSGAKRDLVCLVFPSPLRDIREF